MFVFGLVMGALIVLLLECIGAILYRVLGGLRREAQRLVDEEIAEAERAAQAQAWTGAEVHREARRQLAVQQEMTRLKGANAGV